MYKSGNKIKNLEFKVCHRVNPEYIHCKEKLENVIIRSKSDWYEHWENRLSFLLILKKGILFKIRLEQFHAMKKK